MEFRDRCMIVTGGASGIGRALCQRFAAEGARVVVADIGAEGAESVASEIGGLAVTADVADQQQVAHLVARAEAEYGPVELFASNAGVLAIGGIEVDDTEWQKLWSIHVMAHVYAARAVLPSMLARGRGTLLQTSSAAGLLNQIGSAPYGVTKHAALGFAEWLAITYGDRGIHVAALCPQAVRTGMTGGDAADSDSVGAAGVDGLLEPDAVADCVMAGLAAGHFLILPHPSVAKYMRRKADDYDRWLDGMRRLQARLMEAQ